MQTHAMAEATRRRGGRPAKSDAEKLSASLRLHVTPHEADSLYRFAMRHGKPLNTVLRAILRRFVTEFPAP